MNASSGNIDEPIEYKTAAKAIICSQLVPDGYSVTKSSRETGSLPSSRASEPEHGVILFINNQYPLPDNCGLHGLIHPASHSLV